MEEEKPIWIQVAGWVDGGGGGSPELLEFVGFGLESDELVPLDPADEEGGVADEAEAAAWGRNSWPGPHRRTVPSSEAEARRWGQRGFQWTQLTVREWPVNVANGISRRICQTNTLLSI